MHLTKTLKTAALTACFLIPAATGFGQVCTSGSQVWAGPPVAVAGGYNQEVYVQNTTTASIPGPVSVVLYIPKFDGIDGELTSPTVLTDHGNITVVNRARLTRAIDGSVGAVVLTNIGGGQSLPPGQVARGVAQIRNSSAGFQPRLASCVGALPPALAAANDTNGNGISNLVLYDPATGGFSAFEDNYPSIGAAGIVAGPGAGGAPGLIPIPADYDGDGRVDAAVYNKNTGDWTIRNSYTGLEIVARLSAAAGEAICGGNGNDSICGGNGNDSICGGNGNDSICGGNGNDSLVPADYDGDGKVDIARYRRSSGEFRYRSSRTGRLYAYYLGNPASQANPTVGDFSGDGVADFGVLQGGQLIYRASGSGTVTTLGIDGGADDDQVSGDWDGDGIADPAYYRRSTGVVTVRSSLLGRLIALQASAATTGQVEVDFGRYSAGTRGGLVLRDGMLVKVYDFVWGVTNPGGLTASLNNEVARLAATLQASLNNEIARVATSVRRVY